MDTLSEDEVFANDVDPLDAIREIRRAEGVAEEDLPVADTGSTLQEADPVAEGEDELDTLREEKEESVITNVDEDDTGDTEEEEEETGKEEEEVAVIKRKFTANGQEFEFTQEEILEQFEVVFGQAMDYTQKTQKLSPYRKMISALESESITAEQLNVAIDALKGNKQAIKTLLDANGIDPFEMGNDEDNSYSPTNYGKTDIQLGIEDITNSISKDPEYKITVDVIDRQWDDKSRQAFVSNPSMIQGLHSDIRTGVYDKVAPVAMKMKVLDGNTKSDIEYYMLAGEQVLSAEEQNSAKAKQTVSEMNKGAQEVDEKFDRASSEAEKKRAASTTRSRSDTKGVIDYLDDGDEAYDAWYKNLQASN